MELFVSLSGLCFVLGTREASAASRPPCHCVRARAPDGTTGTLHPRSLTKYPYLADHGQSATWKVREAQSTTGKSNQSKPAKHENHPQCRCPEHCT